MANENKKDLSKQINIMQASQAGAPIVVKAYDARGWMPVEEPSFNWGTSDYKVGLDYTDLFNSAVSSINYTELYNTLFYLDRGKNLGNTIDYSVQVLEGGKTSIANNVKLKFNEEFQSVQDDLTVEDIKDTQVYAALYRSLRDKYLRQAEADIKADPLLLETYGNLNGYFEYAYKSSIDKDMNSLVGELNTAIKDLTNESTIQTLINISDDTIDDIILQQKSKSETDLYTNNADSIDTLKSRMKKVMATASEKYENALDDTYAVAYDDDIRVTIKKQLEEETPAISINYSLFNYALNGDENPQMDWGYNSEGKVVTVTGITPSEAQALVDTSYSKFMVELKKEADERKNNDDSIINRVSQTESVLTSRVTKLIDDSKKEIDSFEAGVSAEIGDLKQNGNFVNLTVDNPIQGSFIGNTFDAVNATVRNTLTSKDITASEDIKSKNITTSGTITSNGTLYAKNTEGNSQELNKLIVDLVYPVGTLYWTEKNPSEFNPNTAFADTEWKRITDKFIYAAKDGDNTYGNGKTGGSKTQSLTVANLPAHNHNVAFGTSVDTNTTNTQACLYPALYAGNTTENGISMDDTVSVYGGGNGKTTGDSFSIMPPYEAKICWVRTK